jgi:DNA primase small subunit
LLGREKIETQKVVKEKFTQYYNENSGKIQAPSLIGKREFAFVLLKEKVMLRHRGMATVEDLRSILKETAPSDVYYSCAYYENPDKSMETKGWLGADLVFDIDADHIPSKHIKEHDSTNWLCEVCLELAKEETLKLVDVLASDFGLSLSDLRVAFSGNRGYHVHVENESLISLDQTARKEIVDYMRGIGIEPIFHGFEKEKGPSLDDAGWAGRIARGI